MGSVCRSQALNSSPDSLRRHLIPSADTWRGRSIRPFSTAASPPLPGRRLRDRLQESDSRSLFNLYQEAAPHSQARLKGGLASHLALLPSGSKLQLFSVLGRVLSPTDCGWSHPASVRQDPQGQNTFSNRTKLQHQSPERSQRHKSTQHPTRENATNERLSGKDNP